jgi:hypothetical protein
MAASSVASTKARVAIQKSDVTKEIQTVAQSNRLCAMIRVVIIEVNPASCTLSHFLEILCLTFVQNGRSASVL